MPSGAKKRKAAKKKKEIQSNNHSSSSSTPTHPLEDEHHDDRECDVGEEEEIERESKLSNLPSTKGLRSGSGEKHIEVEESVVQIEREFKIEDESHKKHGSVEHDGGSSRRSSSGSNSDDETQRIKNEQAKSSIASVDPVNEADSLSGNSVEAIHNSPIAEAADSIVGNVPAADSEKVAVLSEQVEVDVQSRKEEAILQSNDRSTSPRSAPIATAEYGAEHVKDSVVTQPVLASSPFPVQKTSWKSCCGLFEVFSRAGS